MYIETEGDGPQGNLYCRLSIPPPSPRSVRKICGCLCCFHVPCLQSSLSSAFCGFFGSLSPHDVVDNQSEAVLASRSLSLSLSLSSRSLSLSLSLLVHILTCSRHIRLLELRLTVQVSPTKCIHPLASMLMNGSKTFFFTSEI